MPNNKGEPRCIIGMSWGTMNHGDDINVPRRPSLHDLAGLNEAPIDPL